ncbi:tRNA pseudouridine(55) synthase TruB [Corynebacterium sp. 320]|uniref:tRNA pseudouridine(55) synthase TruB n=1 Tax=Corynebacterium TaxID=1716 RepID=UPI00125CCFC8|nr:MULTISPECIES: tRNA pseudouridine(55) synthase TruB [Corynebacterium]KAB1503782.1 tRNA pseudouridine(55) synthase TruB [Corynebacterium sp. 320]KAB1553118.1 tRNA pseudouridine(55) synthase TruB [Corynebacterium sp. 321]KAB1553664.1 tRNA pseudouridine(55) synthase TruB [Corynebacterium sp. 319]KAB3527918.1 tRNA pseudouridine(55) synthase TruB [Corynebacterium sp. 250]KAB3540593.1 tRNA pseudouridine(55) synthase TruB [Corynebacterium sp. 366]
MSSILDSSGVVLVDKPAGMTSHDVVARLRRIMGTRRVGHSGTLDPMATGVLVVGVERGTKFLAHVVTHDKRYEATMRLGMSTVTDDAEGDVLSSTSTAGLTEERVRQACARQVGDIMQRPSSVSSIKIDGRRAHERVRAGEDVVLPERPVTVHSLDILGIDAEAPDHIDVRMAVHCSSGTYIRSIARDVGEDLGVGGHLVALRRTSVGPFDIADCRTLEQLEEDNSLTMDLDTAMIRCFPTREISEEQGTDIAMGKWLEPVGRKEVYAVVTPSGQAMALLKEQGRRAASVFVARPHGL